MTPQEFILMAMGIMGGTAFMMMPVFIVRMVLKHRERLEAIKNRVDSSPRLIEEMENLRREMVALRETTTRFDMSFDAALARAEQRLDGLEQERTKVSPSAYGSYEVKTESDTVVLNRR